MGKIGRNDPCPCGSGKKYKICCLDSPGKLPKAPPGYTFAYLPIDKLSNSINGLLRKRNFREARVVCQKLLDEYPDQIDGISRYAQVYEAMGNRKKAAEYFRKAADFATVNEDFDQESVDLYLEDAKRMEFEG